MALNDQPVLKQPYPNIIPPATGMRPVPTPPDAKVPAGKVLKKVSRAQQAFQGLLGAK